MLGSKAFAETNGIGKKFGPWTWQIVTVTCGLGILLSSF
jgi:hypothetical protein